MHQWRWWDGGGVSMVGLLCLHSAYQVTSFAANPTNLLSLLRREREGGREIEEDLTIPKHGSFLCFSLGHFLS